MYILEAYVYTICLIRIPTLSTLLHVQVPVSAVNVRHDDGDVFRHEYLTFPLLLLLQVFHSGKQCVCRSMGC